MEERIKKQITTIAELKKQGLDTDPAVKQLAIIRRAVKEMSFQLTLLASTSRDAKRAPAKPARKK